MVSQDSGGPAAPIPEMRKAASLRTVGASFAASLFLTVGCGPHTEDRDAGFIGESPEAPHPSIQ